MFMRSRPWRARGPSFDSRAGPRRRGQQGEGLLAHGHGASSDGGSELDVDIDADFGVGVSVEAEREENAAAALSPSVPIARVPAPRIDESGLVALARRAEVQAQQRLTLDVTLSPNEVAAMGPLRHLLAPRRSELSIVPLRRRTA